MSFRRGLMAIGVALLMASLAAAQTQPNLENGFKAYGSYDSSTIDTINLMNGNLIVHIPMPFNSPQRGNLAGQTLLSITSKGWRVIKDTPDSQHWMLISPDANLGQVAGSVGFVNTLDLTLHRFYAIETGGGGPCTNFSAYGYYLTTWDGAVHQLTSASNAPRDCSGTPLSFDAIDNSGYHVEMGNINSQTGVPGGGVITDRQGRRYQFNRFATRCGHPVQTNAIIEKPTSGLNDEPYGVQNLINDENAFLGIDSNGHFKKGAFPLFDTGPVPDQGPPGGVDPTYITTCQQSARIGTVTDANGNVIHTVWDSAPSDTMGRPVSGLNGAGATNDFTGCVSPNSSLPISAANILNFPGPGGVTNQIKVCWASFPIQTNFSQPGITQFQTFAVQHGINPRTPLVTTVILSDAPNWTGTRWAFNYDGYLNLTDLGLPTGGVIHYEWTEVALPNNGQTEVSRGVAARNVNDNNGHISRLTYSWETLSSNLITNTVTDDRNNDTVHTFTLQNGASSFYETSTQYYQGLKSAGVQLQQVDTSYSPPIFYGGDGGNGGAGGIFPLEVRTTIKAGDTTKVKSVTRRYDQGPGNNRPAFGNVIAERESDWGVVGPGPLLREADMVYQWQKDSRYVDAGLLDLPASVSVIDTNAASNTKPDCPVDASGTVTPCAAETDSYYDEYSNPDTPLQAYPDSLPPGTHVAPSNSVRGNLTTFRRWLYSSNGFTAIDSHSAWYDTGLLYQAIDALRNRTTHFYDSVYAGAYLTKTCNALNQLVSATYDVTTGVPTSFTDANAGPDGQAKGDTSGDLAHTTSYSYDSMARLTLAKLPPDPNNSGEQALVKFEYSMPNVFPFTVKRSKSTTVGGALDSVTTTYDGLGRVIKTEHPTPSGVATVDTAYDQLGQVASTSNPYFDKSDPTFGLIQAQYDALGRLSQTTRQDGSIAKTDYSQGNCSTTKDEAGKQRRACTDGLGRLIEVDEPNPGAPASVATGTITISGSEQTSQPGFPGSGTATINGTEQRVTTCPAGRCITVWDQGTVNVTVNSFSKNVPYGQQDTGATIAASLAAAFNNDGASPVSASASGNVLTLRAKANGSGTNYTLATNTTTKYSDNVPSFTTSNAAALSGGQTASTSPDSGTISGTINGTTYTISYGAGDIASSIASRVAAAISAGNVASASATGNTVTVSSKTPGSGGNYSLSSSSTYNTGQYVQPSFTTVISGSRLSGGYDAGDVSDNPLITLYSYDALGNLLAVTQQGGTTDQSQWRKRSFAYDSLSRLLSATNPESGTINYAYDNNGNLITKTDARGVTINYSPSDSPIDALNRVTKITFSNGDLPETFTYDRYAGATQGSSIGRLVRSGRVGGHYFWYDALGRVTGTWQCLPSDCSNGASVGASYDLAGNLTQLTYPDSRVVSYRYNSANQLNQIQFAQWKGAAVSAYNYWTAADNNFYANGTPKSVTFGNGVVESYSFNTRLQPTEDVVAKPGAAVFADRAYQYTNATVSGNNGNIMSVVDKLNAAFTQSFTYDSLNRLSTANEGRWALNFVYDSWGNRLQQNVTTGNLLPLQVYADAQNRIHSVPPNSTTADQYAYDVAGNMLKDGTNQYSFDAESRIASVNGNAATYTYDADGNRLRKDVLNGAKTEYVSFVGNVIAEKDVSTGNWTDYVIAGGRRVAKVDSSVSEINLQGTNTAAGSIYVVEDHERTASHHRQG